MSLVKTGFRFFLIRTDTLVATYDSFPKSGLACVSRNPVESCPFFIGQDLGSLKGLVLYRALVCARSSTLSNTCSNGYSTRRSGRLPIFGVQIKGLVDCPPDRLGVFTLRKRLIYGSPVQTRDMKISCPGPGIGSAKGLLHAIPEVSKSHGNHHIGSINSAAGTLNSCQEPCVMT